MRCRSVEAAEFAGHIAGAPVDPPEQCAEPPAYRVQLVLGRGDLEVEYRGWFAMCRAHERDAHEHAAHGGSWVLRQPVNT